MTTLLMREALVLRALARVGVVVRSAVDVPMGATSVVVPGAAVPTDAVFVTPSWLTTVAAPLGTRTSAGVEVVFGTPAPMTARIDVLVIRT